MVPIHSRCWSAVCLGCLLWTGAASAGESVLPPAACPEAVPQVLSLDAAVHWALEHNPELAALRQQHGIAAAAVIIAQTYPFNPFWEGKIRGDNGPESAGITNRVAQEHKLLLEVEVKHQRRYREQEAAAALSRTDWEIVAQELSFAVRAVRAFNGVMYRQDKLRLLEEIVRLDEEAEKQVRQLVDQARLRPADLILARTEIDDARAQIGLGRQSSVTALFELRRVLGAVDECLELSGSLETSPRPYSCAVLTQTALDTRPERHARQLAIDEAEARLQLAIANRCGNPVIGPIYEYNETRVNFIGGQINLPLPVFNRHQGEIRQREAERARAAADLRQTEVVIHQDVQTALARLDSAQAWVSTYQSQILPNLRSSMDALQRLFAEGDPGVDFLRVLDVRRKLLRARSEYLDALFELSQARADLAAAVGDPALAMPCGDPVPAAGP